METTEAMLNIFMDNKNDIKIETEVNSVVEVDEIHIKVESKEEIEDDIAPGSSPKESFDNNIKYEVVEFSTGKDAESLEEHLKTNPECKQFENREQNVDIEQAIEHYTCVKPAKSSVEWFPCDKCNKSFTQKSSLNNHKVKTTTCEFCGESFANNSSLNLHKLIHTGEKPHSCDVCCKSFARKSCVKAHKKLHHAEVYPCDVCNQLLPDRNSLPV